ncbi:hypothetical protein SDJN02_13417 [Cucurbita argyrosperma subsp. argyrosperma]
MAAHRLPKNSPKAALGFDKNFDHDGQCLHCLSIYNWCLPGLLPTCCMALWINGAAQSGQESKFMTKEHSINLPFNGEYQLNYFPIEVYLARTKLPRFSFTCIWPEDIELELDPFKAWPKMSRHTNPSKLELISTKS